MFFIGGIFLTFIPFIVAISLYVFGHCTTADYWVEAGFIVIFIIWFCIGAGRDVNAKSGLLLGGLITFVYYLVFVCFLFENLNPYWKYNIISGRPPNLTEIEKILESKEKIDLHKKIYVKSIIQVDKFKSLKEGEDTVKNEAKNIALKFKGKNQKDIREFIILKKNNNLNKELMEFTIIISIALK